MHFTLVPSYGLLVNSIMLFYKRLMTDLTKYGFKVNPYNPCVAINKMVDGKQLAVLWHVDNLKASRKDTAVIYNFITWIKDTYGKIGKVKVVQGKVHNTLGMQLDYQAKRQVLIGMVPYIKSLVTNFPQEDLLGPKVRYRGMRIYSRLTIRAPS